MFKYSTDNAFTPGIVPITRIVYNEFSDTLKGFNQDGEVVMVCPTYLFATLEEVIGELDSKLSELKSKIYRVANDEFEFRQVDKSFADINLTLAVLEQLVPKTRK